MLLNFNKSFFPIALYEDFVEEITTFFFVCGIVLLIVVKTILAKLVAEFLKQPTGAIDIMPAVTKCNWLIAAFPVCTITTAEDLILVWRKWLIRNIFPLPIRCQFFE